MYLQILQRCQRSQRSKAGGWTWTSYTLTPTSYYEMAQMRKATSTYWTVRMVWMEIAVRLFIWTVRQKMYDVKWDIDLQSRLQINNIDFRLLLSVSVKTQLPISAYIVTKVANLVFPGQYPPSPLPIYVKNCNLLLDFTYTCSIYFMYSVWKRTPRKENYRALCQ